MLINHGTQFIAASFILLQISLLINDKFVIHI